MSTLTQFVHFDSIYSNYINDPTSTCEKPLNAYRTNFPLNQSFRKLKRIYLKSLEFPVGFANVRRGSTDSFSFTINGHTYNFVMAEKNYTTIALLLTDINSYIFTTFPTGGYTMVISVNPAQGLGNASLLIQFTNTTSFQWIDTNLSKYLLGFRSTDLLQLTTTVYSSNNFNLNPDNYILMSIPTLSSFNGCMSGIKCTFKVPFNAIQNQIYFYQNGSSYEQWVDIDNKDLCITNLEVNITDRYGKALYSWGWDYSFTLAFESEK